MTQRVYKQHSYVGLPTTGPHINNNILLQSFLTQLQLIPAKETKMKSINFIYTHAWLQQKERGKTKGGKINK